MCGIAGFSGNFSAELLTQMQKKIHHRGPDATGQIRLTHDQQTVGLTHTRLAIIDLSTDSHQPMTVNCVCCNNTNDPLLWLSYNGELYNYKTLRAELIAKGHQFKSQSDSEVLLHLYAEEGHAMLQRLNGIFAFALYDGRRQGQKKDMQAGDLLIARDGVGVKPLYYSETHSGFLFASELKALLACSEIKRDIDATAIHYYLAYLWCPGEQTALSAIKKLTPGAAVIVRNGRLVKQWHFYDYPYAGVRSTANHEVIAQELDERLTQAVDRQLMADVPVGAFLSGGLDSSAIVAMMRKLQPDKRIDCYTIAFKGGMQSEGNPDDLPYAKAVAQHLNVNLHVLEVEADMIQNLQHMIYHLDEPQADPAAIHVHNIATCARQDGMKVLLSGTGGDDIFSGYRRHHALRLEKYWHLLPFSLRRSLAQQANKMLAGKYANKHMQNPHVRRIAKLLAPLELTQDQRIANYFLWSPDHLRQSLYSAEIANHMASIDTAEPLLASLERIPHEQDPLNRMLYLEGKHFLADHNLNYTDKMGMAAGVEVRVPLLDPDLIAFATRIPTRFKQKGKVGKAIFKKTMERYLPKEIIYRPKAGFGAPLRRWLHHELAPLIQETLSKQKLNERGLFDANAVAQLIRWDKEKRIDGAYTIFSLLCIELWCEKFVDG